MNIKAILLIILLTAFGYFPLAIGQHAVEAPVNFSDVRLLEALALLGIIGAFVLAIAAFWKWWKRRKRRRKEVCMMNIALLAAYLIGGLVASGVLAYLLSYVVLKAILKRFSPPAVNQITKIAFFVLLIVMLGGWGYYIYMLLYG